MYELHHLRGKTYYIDGPTNMGVYKLNEKDCVLIDSGTSKEGQQILNTLNKNNLVLKYIVNTHCHIDHAGSNDFLQRETNCEIITSKIEMAFMLGDGIDLSTLVGGYHFDEFKNYYLNNENTKVNTIESLPAGLTSFNLYGHHHGMIGIKTDDDVYFVADSFCSKEIVDKQHILYIYDVKGFLNSLDYVATLNGNIIVPSHSNVTSNIIDIININREKVYEICNHIIDYLETEATFEDIIAEIFKIYSFRMSHNRYLLITSTIRSYLAYLVNEKKIYTYFKEYKLFYKNK